MKFYFLYFHPLLWRDYLSESSAAAKTPSEQGYYWLIRLYNTTAISVSLQTPLDYIICLYDGSLAGLDFSAAQIEVHRMVIHSCGV